ncbi:MAG: alkaline phosphatase family protein [Candidatus Aminicenantes bacterium]|nr:alkaline phosphatase family protein [Candidatus Aminicenantes bacterium]
MLNWFCTFPAEKVNSYLISDRFRVSIGEELEGDSYIFPETLMENILPQIIRFEDKLYGKIARQEGIKDYLSLSKKLELDIPDNRDIQLRRFRRYFLQDKSIENVALYLYENVPVDFFAAYLRLIDTTSHFASMFLEENVREQWEQDNEKHGGPTPETEKLLYANMVNIIEPIYAYMDNAVGRLLEKTKEETTIIIIFDHGFNFSVGGYNHYDTPVIPHGIIIMKGPGIKPGSKLTKAKVYDLAPTLLHHFQLPAAEDMDGEVIREAYLKKRKVRMISTYEDEETSQQTKQPRPWIKKSSRI